MTHSTLQGAIACRLPCRECISVAIPVPIMFTGENCRSTTPVKQALPISPVYLMSIIRHPIQDKPYGIHEHCARPHSSPHIITMSLARYKRNMINRQP
jgi:hypothetical protein